MAERMYLNEKGMEVPSVTHVLSIIQKPGLLYWANSLGFRGKSYKRTLEGAAWLGTLTHAAIESYIERQMFVHPTTPPIFEVADRYHRWREWYDLSGIIPLATEKTIVGERYGGTIDLIASLGGKDTIVDWKTSKAFYPEMFLQLSAYANLVNLYTEHEIEKAMIVLVHEDGIQTRSINKSQIQKLYPIFESYLKAWEGKKDIDSILEGEEIE